MFPAPSSAGNGKKQPVRKQTEIMFANRSATQYHPRLVDLEEGGIEMQNPIAENHTGPAAPAGRTRKLKELDEVLND